MPAKSEPQIAVMMDTKALEDDDLVWNCPQLGRYTDYEYSLYGTSRGLGCKAVAFKDLKACEIMDLFPELKKPPCERSIF